LSDDIAAFGKALREFAYVPGRKEVLCPYWQRTDYGTVRCNFLGREVIDDESGALQRIGAHFGVSDALDLFAIDNYLSDEIKVCDRNLETDEWGDTSVGS